MLGLATGSAVGQRRGYPPSAALSVSALGATVASGTYTTGSSDIIGIARPAIQNQNQFFFQGSNQSLVGLLTTPGSPPTVGSLTNPLASPMQLASPATVGLTLLGATAFAAGANITIQGNDINGTALPAEVINVAANGLYSSTTVFKTITGITVTGVTPVGSATLAVNSQAPTTQYDTASSLAVDNKIANDASLIAASSTANAPGNQTNALALLNVQQNGIVSDGQQSASFGDYYGSVVTSLGDNAQQIQTTTTTEQQLIQHLTNQQQSIVGVSVDQEASDLVALQHAYQAAARAITTQDDMLNTIINGMGLVGR